MNYPNWVAADKVLPSANVVVSYDSVATKWRYDYSIANSVGALQGIEEFLVKFGAPALDAVSPAGWDAFVIDTPAVIPGGGFATLSDDFVNVPGGVAPAAGPAPINAGQTLSGFSFLSAYPPGVARTYMRGYAALPYVPDSVSEEVFRVPHDTTNSQRGWTLAPTRYTTIVTQGTQETTDLARANKFLSFMNVDTVGTTLHAPAAIALKFDNGSQGDFVIRASFRALLNGVDVTSYFHPGPSDGADLVAVFTIGVSPLTAGANTLKTFVSGLPSTISRTAIPSVIDTDTILFNVVP